MVEQTDTVLQKKKVSLLRQQIREQKSNILDEVYAAVNWYSLTKPLEEAIGNKMVSKGSFDMKLIVKSLILQRVYGLTKFPFEVEVADRKSFQKFLDLSYGDTIPTNEVLDEYKELMEKEGLYVAMFDSFFRQLFDADIIFEQDLLKRGDEEVASDIEKDSTEEFLSLGLIGEKSNVHEEDIVEESQDLLFEGDIKEERHTTLPIPDMTEGMSVDDMIKEIEDRVKTIYDKKTPEEKEILKKSEH